MSYKTVLQRVSVAVLTAMAIGLGSGSVALASPSIDGRTATPTQWDKVSAVIDANPDVFGGVTVDQASGFATIYLASRPDNSPQTTSAMRSILSVLDSAPAPGESSLWTLKSALVNRSARELRGIMNQVESRASWRTVANQYVSRWFADPASGTVQIGVTTLSPALMNAARNEFGNSVSLSVMARSTNLNRTYNGDYAPPWYGGDGINGDKACSEAFAVTYAGNYGLLSAGHCESLSSTVYEPWNFNFTVGTVGWQRYGNNLYDAEFINAASSAGYVYYSGYSYYHVKGYNQAYVGDPVCFDGAVTEQVCTGGIVRRDICETTTDGVYHCGMAEVMSRALLAQPGDSGGPVYQVSGGAWAQGIIASCVQPSYTDCYITPIYKIINDGIATLRTT